jgi:prepilin-type N-terminal cleavage/methylation domain-containing protein
VGFSPPVREREFVLAFDECDARSVGLRRGVNRRQTVRSSQVDVQGVQRWITHKPRARAAFSLIELVIVIVIIGIIGAIAVPKLAGASDRAVDAQVIASTGYYQRAIDTYMAEHNNRCPATNASGVIELSQVNFRNRLRGNTDSLGNVGAGYLFGPYLKDLPINMANRRLTVRFDGAAAGENTTGWRYDTVKKKIEGDDSARGTGGGKMGGAQLQGAVDAN